MLRGLLAVMFSLFVVTAVGDSTTRFPNGPLCVPIAVLTKISPLSEIEVSGECSVTKLKTFDTKPTNVEEEMEVNKNQLRAAIRDVLTKENLWSAKAEELLMLTAATESNLGEYIRQIGGPARGIFQMEPATEQDIWENYLNYKPELKKIVQKYETEAGNDLELNLGYQIIMARIHYLRVKEPIPNIAVHMGDSPYANSESTRALADYWKKHYNTPVGAGTVTKAIMKYNNYVVA